MINFRNLKTRMLNPLKKVIAAYSKYLGAAVCGFAGGMLFSEVIRNVRDGRNATCKDASSVVPLLVGGAAATLLVGFGHSIDRLKNRSSAASASSQELNKGKQGKRRLKIF